MDPPCITSTGDVGRPLVNNVVQSSDRFFFQCFHCFSTSAGLVDPSLRKASNNSKGTGKAPQGKEIVPIPSQRSASPKRTRDLPAQGHDGTRPRPAFGFLANSPVGDSRHYRPSVHPRTSSRSHAQPVGKPGICLRTEAFACGSRSSNPLCQARSENPYSKESPAGNKLIREKPRNTRKRGKSKLPKH